MSRHDAEEVQRLLREAGERSKPLKDPGLTRKIGEAAEYVTKKLDPKQGG